MMTEIEVVGMSIHKNVDFSLKTAIMGIGEVRLPEMSAIIRGIALARTRQGYRAFPPFGNKDGRGIGWDANKEFGRELARKLLDIYVRMGGEMPEKAADDRHGSDSIKAAAAGRVEHRVFPFEVMSIDGKPFDAEPEADDHEATEGLHRTLGVDAIAETMERAGL
jgi:hypothetical protein